VDECKPLPTMANTMRKRKRSTAMDMKELRLDRM
jgi:hypothetical protein